MRQAPGEAVQKLCPRCSTLAYTSEGRCPWCGSSYKRRIVPALAALLLLQTALILGGLAYLAVLAGDEVDTRIDREVTRFSAISTPRSTRSAVRCARSWTPASRR